MDSKKEKSNIYDMQGALKASPWRSQQLYAVLFAPIQNFSVEFTEIPDAPLKNHVVFKLDFATPIARRDFTVAMPFGTNKGGSVASGNFESLPGNQDISCVYVSINLSESGTNNGTSSIQIRLATPTPTNQAAAASFQFDLDPKPHIPITLWDMLEAIQGTHPDLPRCMASDLTKFAFRSQGFLPSWDCTRDWISQVFICLHALRFISWTVSAVSSPAPRPPTSFSSIWVANAGFHEVIGKKYWTRGTGSSLSGNREVFCADSLVEVGLVMSPGFVRLEGDCKARYQLPYGKEGVVGVVMAGRGAGRG